MECWNPRWGEWCLYRGDVLRAIELEYQVRLNGHSRGDKIGRSHSFQYWVLKSLVLVFLWESGEVRNRSEVAADDLPTLKNGEKWASNILIMEEGGSSQGPIQALWRFWHFEIWLSSEGDPQWNYLDKEFIRWSKPPSDLIIFWEIWKLQRLQT